MPIPNVHPLASTSELCSKLPEFYFWMLDQLIRPFILSMILYLYSHLGPFLLSHKVNDQVDQLKAPAIIKFFSHHFFNITSIYLGL